MAKYKKRITPLTGSKTIHQKFSVEFDYPVHFTRGIFRPDNPLLFDTFKRLGSEGISKALFCIDSGLLAAQKDLPCRIDTYFHHYRDGLALAGNPEIIPGGMQAKTDWLGVRDLITTTGNCHLDRQSFIVAIGGGSVLDMVGFASSIVHRGLRFIRLPTTTLAQDDAGIGVKNGMDEHGQKNFIGTFAPPFAVINDFEFLSTLSDVDWVAGLAEALKVAIIKDAKFYEFLSQNTSLLRGRDSDAMEEAIRRCAIIHLDHIATGGDPFEFGSARPLDFGHWSAHMLETMSNYTISHGQAVSIGIAIDSYCAMKRGMLRERDLLSIIETISATGLCTFSELLKRRNSGGQLDILAGLELFREHLGGVLTVTLPRGIGSAEQVNHINPDDVEDAIDYLEYFSNNRPTSQAK